MIDLVLYHAEADLLALRMAVLAHRVRCHGVVEGCETFSGMRKAPTLPSDPRFGTEWHRLSCLVPERLDTSDPWAREAFQRDCLARFVVGLADDTLVLLGDVDEIPDPSALPGSAAALPSTNWGPMAVFQHSHRAFDARNVREAPWMGSIVTTAGTLLRLGAERLRNHRRSELPIAGSGWHFTHMGGLARLQAKLASFSHQELNTPEHQSRLADRIAHGVDPFGRETECYNWRPDADLPQPLASHPTAFPSLWRDPPPEASK